MTRSCLNASWSPVYVIRDLLCHLLYEAEEVGGLRGAGGGWGVGGCFDWPHWSSRGLWFDRPLLACAQWEVR